MDTEDLTEMLLIGIFSILLTHYYRSFFRLDEYSEPGVGHAYIIDLLEKLTMVLLVVVATGKW